LKEDLMILKKRRSSRKSRRVRLPSASYTGTTRFTPSAEEWQRTENPLGLRFSEENRQELADIVDAYFKFVPFETAAPFANDAQAYLNDVRTKANAFWKSLSHRLRSVIRSFSCSA
jgi:hypothetical protein